MDKLLLSTLVITAAVVLTSMPVSSAPMQTSKLISSIDPLQKRYNYLLNDSGDDMIAAATSTVVDSVDDDGEVSAAAIAPKESLSEANAAVQQQLKKDDNPTDNSSSEPSASKMTKGTRLRQNKMIGFYPAAPATVSPYHPFGYYYNQPPPPPAVYYPPEFYDDFATFFDNYGGEDDEIMSRTSPGGRRRPIYKNSPIYYIRLPPQPYMFIPGLGWDLKLTLLAAGLQFFIVQNSFLSSIPSHQIRESAANLSSNEFATTTAAASTAPAQSILQSAARLHLEWQANEHLSMGKSTWHQLHATASSASNSAATKRVQQLSNSASASIHTAATAETLSTAEADKSVWIRSPRYGRNVREFLACKFMLTICRFFFSCVRNRWRLKNHITERTTTLHIQRSTDRWDLLTDVAKQLQLVFSV